MINRGNHNRISRLKRLESTARHYERCKVLAEYSEALSPLQQRADSNCGYTHQAKQGLDPDHPKGRSLQQILQAAERAATISFC